VSLTPGRPLLFPPVPDFSAELARRKHRKCYLLHTSLREAIATVKQCYGEALFTSVCSQQKSKWALIGIWHRAYPQLIIGCSVRHDAIGPGTAPVSPHHRDAHWPRDTAMTSESSCSPIAKSRRKTSCVQYPTLPRALCTQVHGSEWHHIHTRVLNASGWSQTPTRGFSPLCGWPNDSEGLAATKSGLSSAFSWRPDHCGFWAPLSMHYIK
jgi:hypothetical protein